MRTLFPGPGQDKRTAQFEEYVKHLPRRRAMAGALFGSSPGGSGPPGGDVLVAGGPDGKAGTPAKAGAAPKATPGPEMVPVSQDERKALEWWPDPPR